MRKEEMAVPELASVEVENVSRSAFIMRGAVAAGAVYGLTAVGPFIRKALAQTTDGDPGDVEILNFALTLENLENAYYERALKETRLSGDVKELAELIQKDESEHVSGLTTAIEDLGGKPDPAPEVDFGDALSSEDAFLELAQTFEDTGVGAYNGAGPAIKSKDLLATAGSIVQVEARHAAAIRLQRGEPPTETAFDEAIPQDEVLEAVQPFIKS